ncbi:MAG: ArnT family glycosyltransferase, partial [Longimicrobiales bacterium]
LVLAVLLLLTGSTIALAMRHTSTTFDEIVMMAGGARGYATGDWTIAPEHPPLTQYLYGLPIYLAQPSYPDESAVTAAAKAAAGYRYLYAQQFFWQSGNDPERLALLGRAPAVLAAMLLVAVVYGFARTAAGAPAGLLAALLVAVTPDVLAHGGVAYNDVPVALAMFGALWAADRTIRDPSVARGLLAGALVGVALAVKNSAAALAPILGLLLIIEMLQRRRDPSWWRAMLPAGALTLTAIYLALVAAYRGDLTLAEYRYSIDFAFNQVNANAPGYLLGERAIGGFWYFFPVAFLFKTSAAYHILVVLAAGAFAHGLRASTRVHALARSPLRAPLVGVVVLAALLLSSSVNIGFRYALPALPMLAVLVAVGVVRAWHLVTPGLRALIVVTVTWTAIHPLSYYPHFLTYISEYGPGRDQNYQVMVDSNIDWGQGLLELREFMDEQGIDRVRLSYFGSALPSGYGIAYDRLPSFFTLRRLRAPADSAAALAWIAVSATNLAGVYFDHDPFRALRDLRPDYVVANSIYLYHVTE